MIAESTAAKEMERLSGLGKVPTEPSAVRECLLALVRGSESETHCRRIVDALVVRSAFFPSPSEIAETAGELSDELPAECPRCHGVEWIVIAIGGQEAVTRCSCPRGQQLARRDAREKVEASTRTRAVPFDPERERSAAEAKQRQAAAEQAQIAASREANARRLAALARKPQTDRDELRRVEKFLADLAQSKGDDPARKANSIPIEADEDSIGSPVSLLRH